MSEEDIEGVVEVARDIGQYDVAVAIETLAEHGEALTDEDGVELDGNSTLPFYEEDRQLAFILGIAAGAEIQKAYGDEEDPEREVETVQG